MLVDIFSCFDDMNQVFMNFYLITWIFSLMVLVLSSTLFWVASASSYPSEKVVVLIISGELNRSKGNFLGGFKLTVSSLFIFLLMINFIGLVPNVFSPTSHLVLTLSFGFIIWFTLVFSGLTKNPVSFAAGLLPAGAPAALAPFLVLIESISLLVRPVTLSVRLMANMSAGHIVLTLVGNYLSNLVLSFGVGAVSLLMVQVFYTMFEFAISFIQAYIFCLLLTLYADEHVLMMNVAN